MLIPAAMNAFFENRLLLLRVPMLFDVTLGAGIGVVSLSNCNRSPFWEITRWMQSLGSVAFVFLFARIAILDPALWIIVLNWLHFGRASNTFGNVLSEEQCNPHEVSLPPGHLQKDSFVGVRLLVELCHSLFLPWNYSSSQNGLRILRKFSCER